MDKADTSQDTAEHPAHTKRPSILGLLWGVVAVLVALTVVLGGLTLKSMSEASEDLHSSLEQIQSDIDFPLYYPSTLPKDFGLQNTSPSADGNAAVNYTLTYKDTIKIVVTQQPRPKLMEEVNKIREFNTPVGKAYVANLNGRKAGFLLTEKTLMIISSSHEMEVADLQQLLHLMGRL